MKQNPFGDDAAGPRRVNPFGENAGARDPKEPVARLEHAARKIRNLRTQMGAEGLPLMGMRELIQEVSAGLDAAARALRQAGLGGADDEVERAGPGSEESIE